MKEEKLTVIDGETLADLRLPPTRFCVQTLLPQEVSILGGAPKVGKSWLVLDLCVRVARGEPLWGLPTVRGNDAVPLSGRYGSSGTGAVTSGHQRATWQRILCGSRQDTGRWISRSDPPICV